MTAFIHDASILLDLIHTEPLQLFLAIPAGMVTTDFVLGEITEAADAAKLASATRSGTLEVLRSGVAEIESIAAIQASHRALSTADCSVLFHAIRLRAAVLTGDSRLRREATEAGLEVHDTVWAFEELVGRRLLSRELAAGKLEGLLAANPRLPREECERSQPLPLPAVGKRREGPAGRPARCAGRAVRRACGERARGTEPPPGVA